MTFISREESVSRSIAAVEGPEFEKSVPLLFLAHARELAAEVRRLRVHLDEGNDHE